MSSLILLCACLVLVAPSRDASVSLPVAGVRFVDLTGDGAPDLLSTSGQGVISVSVNAGGRAFVPTGQLLTCRAVKALLVSDLDHDGRSDLYLLSQGENVALLGDGTGRFVDATDPLGLADGGSAVSAERLDVDGDGLADVVLHNRATDVLFWARADGSYERTELAPPADPIAVVGGSVEIGVGGQLGDLDLGRSHPHAQDVLQPPVGLTPEEKAILAHMSLVQIDDGSGNLLDTIRISGVNVQVVNGSGATTVSNGLGNLVVGYNETGNPLGDDRSGSHNIVGGIRNSYGAVGGLLAGSSNTLSADWATVSAGSSNVASGAFAAVSGGSFNVASGVLASVTGGSENLATGPAASVTGGRSNVAGPEEGGLPARWASVCGGLQNRALGDYCVVSGGAENEAGPVDAGEYGSGLAASVSGGQWNIAAGDYSSVVGGETNRAGGDGVELFQGTWATVSGGSNNVASGGQSSICGGLLNVISGSVGAHGQWGSILGGMQNTVSGEYATVAGGSLNQALATFAAVSGGRLNEARAQSSVVTGGWQNIASALLSSVTGGWANTAEGNLSTVSGGAQRTASGETNWVAGSLHESN